MIMIDQDHYSATAQLKVVEIALVLLRVSEHLCWWLGA